MGQKGENWQFPQGGIDEGETPKQAAFRELKEETGIVSVEWVTTLEKPIRYDFPKKIFEKFSTLGRDFHGQEQFWSLFYFTGCDEEIDFCTFPEEIEFNGCEWVDIKTTPQRVWKPKQKAYQQMVEIFSPLIDNFKI